LGNEAPITARIASHCLPEWRLIVSANSTLILAVFFFLIGAAVMGLIWYLQYIASGNYRRGKRGKPDPNLAEVACLMRDKTTQDLVVNINGNSYRTATELNPGQLRRMHFTSKVLVKWLADTLPTPLIDTAIPGAAGEPTFNDSSPVIPAPAEATSLPEEWIPAESAPDEQENEVHPAFIEPEPPLQTKPVSTQIRDVVSGILNPTPQAPPAPEYKSIAMQIDAILQEMIANTPFEQRGISVNDAPDHGVMVSLDGKNYPGVKDVPDDEVRGLIRSAVVEWEKTSKFNSRG
jgi:hypothetical protein